MSPSRLPTWILPVACNAAGTRSNGKDTGPGARHIWLLDMAPSLATRRATEASCFLTPGLRFLCCKMGRAMTALWGHCEAQIRAENKGLHQFNVLPQTHSFDESPDLRLTK